jgi:hypothetical protein
VIFSKDGTSYPSVNNTRPICVLPSVFKVFEQSVIANLEKVAFKTLSKNQRGFIPGKSVNDNLRDVLNE